MQKMSKTLKEYLAMAYLNGDCMKNQGEGGFVVLTLICQAALPVERQ